ncbi:MAG: 1-acyl-sn-glycerol-3-phosphate acyltransferase, partial [Planctomycetia bacterium]|nr:1-acyl-sn-glycerol-3-phosphate acyltransferase [Planctomycetia bacterium]
MFDALDIVLLVLSAFVLFAAMTWIYPPLLRPVWWVVAHLLYRFRIYHADRVPATGGVLVIANHVSYLDWLLLWVACPRPVTFVLWGSYYRNPLLR